MRCQRLGLIHGGPCTHPHCNCRPGCPTPQCTRDLNHEGNHAHQGGSGYFSWPRLHMLGAGPIIFRALVLKRYKYRTNGAPFTRAHLATIEPHRCPASREYYRLIDKI
jgi:hypothetical protein